MIFLDGIKILHTADLHLGADFAELSYDLAQLRKSELRQSFFNMVSLHSDADVVLISGDIFDSPDVSYTEADFLVSVFLKYQHIKFLAVCGNHDPYNSPVYEYLCGILPENAVLFSPDGDEIVFHDIKTRVFGKSFQYSCEEIPLLNMPKMPDDGLLNLIVIHGDLDNPKSVYNPIFKETLANSGADYVALGHIHKHRGIFKTGNVTYAYSGTHEGHGYDECGRLGCIYGTVYKNMCDLSFECTQLRSYNKLTIDISEAKNIEAVKKLIEDAVLPENLYKITLSGILNEGVVLNDFVLLSGTQAFDIKLEYDVKQPYNLSEISNCADLKGYFVKEALCELENSLDDAEKSTINKALNYVLNLFDEGTKL